MLCRENSPSRLVLGGPNHRSSDLALPGNRPLHLPPYSLEPDPKENLWGEIREKLFKN
jgi:hypothetical protein